MKTLEKIFFIIMFGAIVYLTALVVPAFGIFIFSVIDTAKFYIIYAVTYSWWSSAIIFTSVTTLLFTLGIKGYFKVLRFGNRQMAKNSGYVPMTQPTYAPVVMSGPQMAATATTMPILPNKDSQ